MAENPSNVDHAAVPVFRPARVDNADAIVALMRMYYAEDGYPFSKDAARTALLQLLTQPAWGRVWVAWSATDAVAYAVLTFGFSLEYRGRDAFVDELYVAAAFRGRRLGTTALSVIHATCVQEDVRALHLEVERDKRGAIEMYRRRGFADHARHLMTKLL